MKSRSPIGSALAMLGYTWGGFIALFVIGNIGVALIFGAEAEMNWPFSFLLVLLCPFVVIGGLVAAVTAFNREGRCRPGGKVEELR